MGRYTGKKYRLIAMIWLTVFYFFLEIIVGYITNSMALVADSFHMLGDIAALIITLLSVEMGPKKWSKNTFGFARAEILGALVNAVFLIALCFSITVEAFKRFIEIKVIQQPRLLVIVGTLGLLVNIIGLLLLYEHGSGGGGGCGNCVHGHTHQKEICAKNHHRQMNMRAAFLHLLSDALGSIIVVISALIVWQTNWKYRYYMDPVLSIVLVALMLHTVWPLFRESSLILLQTVPMHIHIDDVQKRLIEKVDDVLDVHEFHVWQLAGDRIIASAHIRCRNLDDYMKIAGSVKEFFHNEGIHSTTIQPEFIDAGENTEICALDCPITKEGCTKATCCQKSSSKTYTKEALANSTVVNCRQRNAVACSDLSTESVA